MHRGAHAYRVLGVDDSTGTRVHEVYCCTQSTVERATKITPRESWRGSFQSTLSRHQGVTNPRSRRRSRRSCHQLDEKDEETPKNETPKRQWAE
jgi:hypothetical protein